METLWLLSFEFLSAKELGSVAAVNRDFKVYASDRFLWRWLFKTRWLGDRRRTRRNGAVDFVSSAGDEYQRRPQGIDAVGWQVEVFDEQDQAWKEGVVMDAVVQEDQGLLWLQVEYQLSVPLRRWELDQRFMGPWHTRGKTRFKFISNLAESSEGAEHGRDDTDDGQDKCADKDDVQVSAASNAEAALEGVPGDASFDWRGEYRNFVAGVPTTELAVLPHHNDEVLDLQWSDDGKLLATCSRDRIIFVYDVVTHKEEGSRSDGTNGETNGGGSGGLGDSSSSEETKTAVHLTLRHELERRERGSCVCRVAFSPRGGEFLLGCTEEPRGDPFGVDSCVELWRVSDGALVGVFPSTPFDVHAHWMPPPPPLPPPIRHPTTRPPLQFLTGRGIAPVTQRRRRDRSDGHGRHDSKGTQNGGSFHGDAGGTGGGDSEDDDSEDEDSEDEDAGRGEGGRPRVYDGGGSALLSAFANAGENFRNANGSGGGGEPTKLRMPKAVARQSFAIWQVPARLSSPHREKGGAVSDDGDHGEEEEEEVYFDALDEEEQSVSGEKVSKEMDNGLSRNAEGAEEGGVGGSSRNNNSSSGGGGSGDGGEENGNSDGGPGGIALAPGGGGTQPQSPVATIELLFYGVNFAHLTHVSPLTGDCLAFASGDNPWLVHQVHLITGLNSKLARSRGGILRVAVPPPGYHQGLYTHHAAAADEDTEAETPPPWSRRGHDQEEKRPTKRRSTKRRREMLQPPLECGGAVLSLRISRDERHVFVNVRPFRDGLEAVQKRFLGDRFLSTTAAAAAAAQRDGGSESGRGGGAEQQQQQRAPQLSNTGAPDIDSVVVLQVWEIASRTKVAELKGHHAFTTKDCPFLLFTHDNDGGGAAASAFSSSPLSPPPLEMGLKGGSKVRGSTGGFICSGSEDCAAYVWSLRHRRLVSVLRGHSDVVSAVGWNPCVDGLVATASDDFSVKLWGRPTTTKVQVLSF